MDIQIRTVENAPEAARPTLQSIQEKMGGLLPNLYCQMANAPIVLETYQYLAKQLTKTSFSPAEQQLIVLATSVRNGCTYCVAAHSSGARMAGLDKSIINAVRDGETIPDARLQALRAFVDEMVDTRGKVNPDKFTAFTDAGYSIDQALELVIGISMKAMSNTVARLAGTPVDGFLEKMKWAGNDRV